MIVGEEVDLADVMTRSRIQNADWWEMKCVELTSAKVSIIKMQYKLEWMLNAEVTGDNTFMSIDWLIDWLVFYGTPTQDRSMYAIPPGVLALAVEDNQRETI